VLIFVSSLDLATENLILVDIHYLVMARYGGRAIGFYTDKKKRRRPITARRRRQAFAPSQLRVVHIPAPKQLFSFSINRLLTALDCAFPNLIPIFETGRFFINNRELITPFVKKLVSDKTVEKKIETIEKELTKKGEEKIASDFSKVSATTVSNLLREKGCFDYVSKVLNEASNEADVNLLQGFFQNTLEGLIKISISGVLGVAT
jgi:hypothetical protein